MNYRMIKYVLGWVLLFEALFLTAPTLTALICKEEVLAALLWCVAACMAVGFLLILRRPKNMTLYSKEGFVIVSLSWVVLSVFGAMPFYVSGAIPSFVDALFESVSGFTTTGSSILADVESMPRALLLWRSITHWVGGMGVLVFVMAFLPLSGGQNMHIMKAESPGPDVSKLVPRVRTTALILYVIYFCLTLLQFLLLLCGGMSPFDAINTAMATAGTGGFGTRADSLRSFSPYIQWVVTIFMLIFSLNFASYYLAFRGRIKEAFSAEIRSFLLIVAGAGIFIAWNIRASFSTWAEALRHAFFTVGSIISTTGFATVDFDLWPAASKALLVLLMFLGACAGSTGGGIKISRIVILVKGMLRELRVAIHPKQVKKISIDGRPVEHEVVRSVNAYIVCYLVVFAASVFFVSLENHDLVTNFTAVAATLNNVGPGLSQVGPTQNFAFFSTPSKLILIFDMLAGRLELFPMLLLFTPGTWKKQ
ncbi:MAG: TrkH family potassium uptake protein [Ruminococcaceae bacterium]|nr:TrkH family potassium uptake protein [Oscillospiraceae bacterium]